MNLRYDIQTDGNVAIFSLTGKITTDLDYEGLEKDVFGKLNQNYFRIIFNLEHLTHTNSSGISLFMRTMTKARIMGGELVLANVNGNVEKIFKLSKLDEIYTIYPNTADAINHFKKTQ